MKKIKQKKKRRKNRKIIIPKHKKHPRKIEENPPVLYGYSEAGNHLELDKEEYIIFLCETIILYDTDSIYWDDEENLYLYIDKNNFWTAYIGTDEAKEILDYYTRIHLPQVSNYSNGFHTIMPCEESLRTFIDNNFDKSLFDK